MGIDIAAERKRQAAKEAKEAERLAKREERIQATANRQAKLAEEARYSGWICQDCGSIGRARRYVKGSMIVELFLWVVGLLFCWFFLISLIPPIIYSMWRHLSSYKACSQCKGRVIKADSPIGKNLVDTYHPRQV